MRLLTHNGGEAAEVWLTLHPEDARDDEDTHLIGRGTLMGEHCSSP